MKSLHRKIVGPQYFSRALPRTPARPRAWMGTPMENARTRPSGPGSRGCIHYVFTKFFCFLQCFYYILLSFYYPEMTGP